MRGDDDKYIHEGMFFFVFFFSYIIVKIFVYLFHLQLKYF